MRRRRLLGLTAGVAVTLSGCTDRSAETGVSTTDQSATATGSTEPTPAPAWHLGRFVLWNDDDEPHRVGLRVSRDGAVLVDETRDLGPGVSADVENPIETQGVFAVVATVDGLPRAEREWRVSNCSSIEYLQVYVADAQTVEIRTKRQTIDPHPTC